MKTLAYKNNFINKANKIHANKYDYSNVNYINDHIRVTIICPKHGRFEKTPNDHTSGKQGCSKCSGKYRYNTESFIEEAMRINGEQYDYSLVNYKNNKEKIVLICKIHGEFKTTPNGHLSRGYGCPNCADNKKLTTISFIEKAKNVHKNKYDYSLVNYKNDDTKIVIICKIHGKFEQNPGCHATLKQGCPKCFFITLTKTQEQFIKEAIEIHGNRYDYSLVKYKNTYTKVIIICKEHGEFKQKPAQHLKYSGCPRCLYKNQQMVGTWLKNKTYKFIEEYNIKIYNKNIFVDFYLGELNLIIEYNGEQHYTPITFGKMTETQAKINFNAQIKRDNMLKRYCVENNIKIIEIDGRKYYNDSLKEYLDTLFVSDMHN